MVLILYFPQVDARLITDDKGSIGAAAGAGALEVKYIDHFHT